MSAAGIDVIARFPASLGPVDGEPSVLGGGITNHNFRVRARGQDYVLRVPGADTDQLGIDRGAEAEATAMAAGLGIGPEVVGMSEGALVTRFIHGPTLDSEALRARVPDVMAALRKVHACGVELPCRFDVVEIVQAYAERARARGVEPPPEYDDALAHAREITPSYEPVPCHNDLLAANFIDEDGTLRIVDWEYAGMGDRWFDLGNFAVNNDVGDTEVLREYFRRDPSAEDLERLRAMRFLSDFREAMWGVVQSAVSDIDFDFTAYAREHFERLDAAR